MFTPASIVLFYHRGKTNGLTLRAQIARGEAIRAEVAFLFQRNQEVGGYADAATNRSDAPNTWPFVAWRVDAFLR
jgi:hypothetical protein